MAANSNTPPQESTGSDGWTNEYVQDGFEVDGSASQLLNVPKERIIVFHKLAYEVLGSKIYLGVFRGIERLVLYPAIRFLCAILSRERTAEQYIAESEFVYATVVESGRGGIGSKHWRLALSVHIGFLLMMGGIGWTVAAIEQSTLIGTAIGLAVIIGGISTFIAADVALRFMPSIE